ncbi:MAG: GNAT family N-acetyltransferase [Firmicutes bacterium]|nr:GNAT family N-acetyltransferase [Bacillota bacterium]
MKTLIIVIIILLSLLAAPLSLRAVAVNRKKQEMDMSNQETKPDLLFRKGPEVTIRDADLEDMPFILDLNRVNVEVLSPMDEEKYQYFLGVSEMFQVAEVGGKPAAFLIALREGLPDYTSENYIWFSNTYDQFLYVDRIVIDEFYRGCGLGRKIYEGVFQRAEETGVAFVTAEIDIVPYNGPSLKFHEAMGFEEVGQQVIRGGEIKVSLQARKIGE